MDDERRWMDNFSGRLIVVIWGLCLQMNGGLKNNVIPFVSCSLRPTYFTYYFFAIVGVRADGNVAGQSPATQHTVFII